MPSQLDEQLAEAAGLGRDDVPAAPERARPGPPLARATLQRARLVRSSRPRKQLGLLIGLLVIVAASVAVVLFGFQAGSVYALPVDALVERQAELVGRRVRIDGELVPGSLAKRAEPCEYRFTMRANGKQVEVSFPQCVVPGNFRDRPEGGVMVTAEGALGQDGRFLAASLLAKCSSRYDPKTRTMKTDG